MNTWLLVAGLIVLALALGHATIGIRWVLPGVAGVRLPGTPFGSGALSLGMVRFTWHVLTVMLVGFAALLLTLATAPDIDARALVLQWIAALWFAATATALWTARRRPRSLLNFPVAFLFPVVAVMTWIASR